VRDGVPTLNDLARDAALAAGLPEPERLRLLALAEGIAGVLRAPRDQGSPSREGEPDGEGMLTVEQAAGMAGVTVEQFYRRTLFRAAIVKLGRRTIRVNERKLRRILAQSEA
jgi:hypothetical protein